jgi:hypothetical protein
MMPLSREMREHQDRALYEGFLVLKNNFELVTDILTVIMGFCSWLSYTKLYQDESNGPAPIAVRAHVSYEVLYYSTSMFINPKMWFHHILSLMILYFAWEYKMGVSMSMFVFSLSNPFMTIVKRNRNFKNLVTFAIMFFIARIIGGAYFWHAFVIDKQNTAPRHLYIPCSLAITGIVGMQVGWFIKIISIVRANAPSGVLLWLRPKRK